MGPGLALSNERTVMLIRLTMTVLRVALAQLSGSHGSVTHGIIHHGSSRLVHQKPVGGVIDSF